MKQKEEIGGQELAWMKRVEEFESYYLKYPKVTIMRVLRIGLADYYRLLACINRSNATSIINCSFHPATTAHKDEDNYPPLLPNVDYIITKKGLIYLKDIKASKPKPTELTIAVKNYKKALRI